MSVRPRPGEQVPSLTAQLARASNPGGMTVMWGCGTGSTGCGGTEVFQAWYTRDGGPGLPPSQLATVSARQSLHNLSDRQTAEAVRCRIDSTHVLAAVRDLTGLELVTEAVRAALEELARTVPAGTRGVVTGVGSTRSDPA